MTDIAFTRSTEIDDPAQVGRKVETLFAGPDGQPVVPVEKLNNWLAELDLSANEARELAVLRETDVGNGQRLVSLFGGGIRYLGALKSWLTWDGKRWALDETNKIEFFAKNVAQSILIEAAKARDKDRAADLARWAVQCQSVSRVEAMIKMARSEPNVPIVAEELDRHPYLLNVANGVLDLETGTLSRHNPKLLITKLAPVAYDPAATCPNWEAWLRRMTGGDADMVRYLQQMVGLSLSGHHLQAFFVFYGGGANGKTTFIETISEMLGDYAVSTKPETLMVRRNESQTDAELMPLRGARFVSSTEPQEGAQLNEGRIKALTGGDTITARPLYANPISFQPEFKLVLGTNHKPIIKGADYAIWRRVKLVPWSVKIGDEEKDEDYRAKNLTPELPGILAWAVRGYQDWVANNRRLSEPATVSQATSAYRTDSDVLGLFLDDECVRDANASVGFTPLYDAYAKWVERNGYGRPWLAKRFSAALLDAGFEAGPITADRRQTRLGLDLRSNFRPAPPMPPEVPPESVDERTPDDLFR